MSIRAKVRKRIGGFISGKSNSKWFQDDGRPRTIIAEATGGGKKGGPAKTERTESLLKKYWDYYTTDGTIFASINTTAWNTVMVGYSISSVDVDAKVLVADWLDWIDLDTILLDNVIYALVFGDAFIEIVRSKADKKIYTLKTVDPTTMQVNIDDFGRETGYQQIIGGKLSDTVLKPEEIIHLKLFPIPFEPYGVSIITPSQTTIDRKQTTDESISNAIIRHGTTKLVFTIGDKDDIPPDAVFTAIKNKLEDLDAKNEFILPGTITVDTIDETGISGVEEYFNYFQTQLIIGLLCPEEALGLGRGSTEATSKVKEIMYERFVKSIQHKLSKQIERNIIALYLKERGFDPYSVGLRFNSVTDADEAVKAKWMGNLLRGFPDGEKPFTIDEIRAVFDYPPLEVEGGDGGLPSKPKPGDKPKPGEVPGEEPEEEKPEASTEEPTKPEPPKKESKKRNTSYLYESIEDVRDDLDSLRDEYETR